MGNPSKEASHDFPHPPFASPEDEIFWGKVSAHARRRRSIRSAYRQQIAGAAALIVLVGGAWVFGESKKRDVFIMPEAGRAARGDVAPADKQPSVDQTSDVEQMAYAELETRAQPLQIIAVGEASFSPGVGSSGFASRSGSGDDEFDELFGTKKTPSNPETMGLSGRTAYIPPEPGGGGATFERLGQSDIMRVVLANKPAIARCVNEQKKKNPELRGKLVMRWVIQTNGTTQNVSCQTPEFRSTYMASCISGLIKGWTFPKHKVQGSPIDFLFTF